MVDYSKYMINWTEMKDSHNAVCVICNNVFGTLNPRQICCGPTCSKERKNLITKPRKRLPPIKKNCVICNNEFEAKGGGSKKRNTCGDECKRLNRNQKAKIRRTSSPEIIASIKLQKKKYAQRPEVKERLTKQRHENKEEYLNEGRY